MKILLVEDDLATVESIKLCLQIFKPELLLTAISDGIQALKALKEETFDGVMLDLGLPNMDGLVILEELNRSFSIPVLVVTARHGESDKLKALQLGAKDYITKPFDIHYLLKSIQVNIEEPAKK
jgi:two-component system, OmpR family, KDP operon response regulator KdpE